MYIFDTNTLTAIFRHYFYDHFPSFWEKFNLLMLENKIRSVREVKKEIEALQRGDSLQDWIKNNGHIFDQPTNEELSFITDIYQVNHFKQNMEMKKLLKGGAFADPFIIAKAKVNNGIVVTQEQYKEKPAKLPNICEYFKIECTDLAGFMLKEKWSF